MHGVRPEASTSLTEKPIVVFGVLAVVLALRLAHLSSALLSPLSYQPGPDEEYYLRFGEAVLAGHGQDAPQYTFMDPAYGYLLGAVFRLTGVSLFAIYALQCLLDTATALGILMIGRVLERPRAGLVGALLYGFSATAIMFSTTLLKEVWVTSLVTWWVVIALALVGSKRRRIAWFAFGLFCGVGIAFRSTLLLLGAMGMLLPLFFKKGFLPAGLVSAGLALAVLPWSIRNYEAYGSLSFLPHNSGVVLHQLYNPNNPESSIWVPDFVNYLEPGEIWRGYADEADRRSGKTLSPSEVDRYWKAEALDFMGKNPGLVVRVVWRKTLKFFAPTEIPINRSLVEERLFSPILSFLPMPAAWLLAMGIAGLLWLRLDDRRWILLAAPILMSLVTMAFFWAEDRFRFHAMGILALCSGVWLDSIVRSIHDHRTRLATAFGGLAALVGSASIAVGASMPAPVIHWDHIVWGYIKMGKVADARVIAQRVLAEQPDDGQILEALGFTDIDRGDYPEAAKHYERAVAVRPRSHVAHYNLAKVYLQLGNRARALEEAMTAMSLKPSPEYQQLVAQAKGGP